MPTEAGGCPIAPVLDIGFNQVVACILDLAMAMGILLARFLQTEAAALSKLDRARL